MPREHPTNGDFSEYADGLHVTSDHIRELCARVAEKGLTRIKPVIPQTVQQFRDAYSEALTQNDEKVRERKLANLRTLSTHADVVQSLRENGAQLTDQDIGVLFDAIGGVTLEMSKINEAEEYNRNIVLQKFEELKTLGVGDAEKVISIHAYFAMSKRPSALLREKFRQEFNQAATHTIYADMTPEERESLLLKPID